MHEVVHIWLGEDDLFNDRRSRVEGVSATEVMCNAVAGELIVPKSVFLRKWDDSDINVDVYTENGAKSDLARFLLTPDVIADAV